MKLKFKIQNFQTEAVTSVVHVFDGQPFCEHATYTRDLGVPSPSQMGLFADTDDSMGYENAQLVLKPEQLLTNIREVQRQNNIVESKELIDSPGVCSLDVEMETGTGKTYVYIKTIFELNKKYGWGKYIVVVPSIAIREGVMKSFQITQDHFMEYYGKKARFFVYNSDKLNDLDQYSSNADIHVMIINTQAFAASFNEDRNREGRAGDKAARIIYSERDEFGSRRPIDVIAANRPILILDEPQKMGGSATQEGLARFNPLFCLNYSATHVKQHNQVFVLDALDAYTRRLVKKIEVKGFERQNLRGINGYLFLEEIVVSHDKAPRARMEIEVRQANGIKRKTCIVECGDELYAHSNCMEQYRYYTVSEIDPIRNVVAFTNGEVIHAGEGAGDEFARDIRRLQIRETIVSHLQKEQELFKKGIKTLSLFFIDEVSHYRQYDESGEAIVGEYGRIFEEEYARILNEYLSLFDEPYQRYLRSISPQTTHTGYFSIDKKGRAVDSKPGRGSDESNDISAYDLILKNKERLLSFEEPVRFIFSHSALREGWDNPNVFQICSLKNSGRSTTQKRQEVGRGLRLCVNQSGERMDADICGEESVQALNSLTVIACEGYADFVKRLQSEIKESVYERPLKASINYFTGKTVLENGHPVTLDKKQATVIYQYLCKNEYIDMDENLTAKYRQDRENGQLSPLPENMVPMGDDIHRLVQSIYDPSVLGEMIENGNRPQYRRNDLNENFYKKEFQELWGCINHRYAYRVEFNSDELIQKAIAKIDAELAVSEMRYIVTTGQQEDKIDADILRRSEGFKTSKTQNVSVVSESVGHVRYDLLGEIARGTMLTRKTVATILSGIHVAKFAMYRVNPEEFLSKTVQLINEEKATMIVEHIQYSQTAGKFDNDIFTVDKQRADFANAFRAKKNVQNYVFTDGMAERSVEKKFADELENAAEVEIYARLPRGFQIPTPVGNYSPDWAIVFVKGKVKHVFFIAETKGSMSSMQLRAIEKAKISCAKKLFNNMSTGRVRYHEVVDYQSLLAVMDSIK